MAAFLLYFSTRAWTVIGAGAGAIGCNPDAPVLFEFIADEIVAGDRTIGVVAVAEATVPGTIDTEAALAALTAEAKVAATSVGEANFDTAGRMI